MAIPSIATDSPIIWAGEDSPWPRSWARRLTTEMIDEIGEAARDALGRGLSFWRVDRALYPLPRTAALLAQAHDDLDNGRGFTVLAGWPVERFHSEENRMAYALVAAHLGSRVVQHSGGDPMIDVN